MWGYIVRKTAFMLPTVRACEANRLAGALPNGMKHAKPDAITKKVALRFAAKVAR
jgi:hypothetical protein